MSCVYCQLFPRYGQGRGACRSPRFSLHPPLAPGPPEATHPLHTHPHTIYPPLHLHPPSIPSRYIHTHTLPPYPRYTHPPPLLHTTLGIALHRLLGAQDARGCSGEGRVRRGRRHQMGRVRGAIRNQMLSAVPGHLLGRKGHVYHPDPPPTTLDSQRLGAPRPRPGAPRPRLSQSRMYTCLHVHAYMTHLSTSTFTPPNSHPVNLRHQTHTHSPPSPPTPTPHPHPLPTFFPHVCTPKAHPQTQTCTPYFLDSTFHTYTCPSPSLIHNSSSPP